MIHELEFHVYDSDRFSSTPHYIGSVSLTVRECHDLKLILTDNKGIDVGFLYIDIFHDSLVPSGALPDDMGVPPRPNLLDEDYMTTLALYGDGYVLLGNGKCRNSKDKSPGNEWIFYFIFYLFCD